MKNVLHGRSTRSFVLSAVLLLVGFAAAPNLQAQQGQRNMDPAARAQQRVELLTQKLQITAAQGEQIKAILLKQYADTNDLRAKAQASGGGMGSMRTEMQTLREEADKKIDAVLTATQKTAYKALVAEETAARAQRRQGGGGR
jgi:Spy/CpxP family protein refolding chaperone